VQGGVSTRWWDKETRRLGIPLLWERARMREREGVITTKKGTVSLYTLGKVCHVYEFV
jgi:hypothetical protein